MIHERRRETLQQALKYYPDASISGTVFLGFLDDLSRHLRIDQRRTIFERHENLRNLTIAGCEALIEEINSMMRKEAK